MPAQDYKYLPTTDERWCICDICQRSPPPSARTLLDFCLSHLCLCVLSRPLSCSRTHWPTHPPRLLSLALVLVQAQVREIQVRSLALSSSLLLSHTLACSVFALRLLTIPCPRPVLCSRANKRALSLPCSCARARQPTRESPRDESKGKTISCNIFFSFKGQKYRTCLKKNNVFRSHSPRDESKASLRCCFNDVLLFERCFAPLPCQRPRAKSKTKISPSVAPYLFLSLSF